MMYPALSPTPIADYLIPIFDEWFADDDPDVLIRIFNETIRVLYGGASGTDSLGNRVQDYLVIDTDGAILANDSLKVCYEGAPESGLNVLRDDFDSLARGAPLLYQLVSEGVPLCSICQACPERDTCGGGYVPNRYSKANGFMNPNVWCKDLMKFITHVR